MSVPIHIPSNSLIPSSISHSIFPAVPNPVPLQPSLKSHPFDHHQETNQVSVRHQQSYQDDDDIKHNIHNVMTESLQQFAYSSLKSTSTQRVRKRIMVKRETNGERDEDGEEDEEKQNEGGGVEGDEMKKHDDDDGENKETINTTTSTSENYNNNNHKKPTGLISSEIITEIRDSGKTTIFHTKQIFGTSIGNLYAHYAKTLSLNTIINIDAAVVPPSGKSIINPTSVMEDKEYMIDPVTKSAAQVAQNTLESILEGSKKDVTLSMHLSRSTSSNDDHTTTNNVSSVVKETSSIDQALNSSLEVTSAKLTLSPSSLTLSSSSSPTPSIHFPSPLRERKVLMTDNKLSTNTVSITTITVTATIVQSTILPNNTMEENESKSMNHGSHTPIFSNNLLRDHHDDHEKGGVRVSVREDEDDEFEEYEDDDNDDHEEIVEMERNQKEINLRRDRFSSAARRDDRGRNRFRPPSSIETVTITPGFSSVPLTSRHVNVASSSSSAPLRARRAGGFGMRKSALSNHESQSSPSSDDGSGRGIFSATGEEDDVWSNWERRVLAGESDDQVPRQSQGASGINNHDSSTESRGRITGSVTGVTQREKSRKRAEEDGGDPSSNVSPRRRSSSRGAVVVTSLRSGEVRSRGHNNHYYEENQEGEEGENSSRGKNKKVGRQQVTELQQESRNSNNLNRLLIHSVTSSSFTNLNPVTPDEDDHDADTTLGSAGSISSSTGDHPGSRSRSRTGIRASSHENTGLGHSNTQPNTRSSSSRGITSSSSTNSNSMRKGRPMNEYPPEVIAAFFGGLTTQQSPPHYNDYNDDLTTPSTINTQTTSSRHAHRHSRLKYVPRPSSSPGTIRRNRNDERTESRYSSSFDENDRGRRGRNRETLHIETGVDNPRDDERRSSDNSPSRRRRRKKGRKSSLVESVVPITVTKTIILEPNTRSVTNNERIEDDERVSPGLGKPQQQQQQIPQQLTNFHHHHQQAHRGVIQPSFSSFEAVNSQPLGPEFSHQHQDPTEKGFHSEPTPSIVKLPKKAITVTSVVSLTKTLPIKHGFKTSFATITTPTLSTSIIQPNQFDYYINPSDTNSLLTIVSMSTKFGEGILIGTDSNSSKKNISTKVGRIETVVVTTTAFDEIKLIPIRVGFSTRTDTLTSRVVMTKLTTLYNSFFQVSSSLDEDREHKEKKHIKAHQHYNNDGGILSNSPGQTFPHDFPSHQGSSSSLPESVLYKWIPSPSNSGGIYVKTETNHGLKTTLTSSLTMNQVTVSSNHNNNNAAIQVTDSSVLVWMQPNPRPLPPSLLNTHSPVNVDSTSSLSQFFSSSPSSSTQPPPYTSEARKNSNNGNNEHNFLTTLVTIKILGKEGVVTDLVTPITLSIEATSTQSKSISTSSLTRNLNKRDVSLDSMNPANPSINNEHDCQNYDDDGYDCLNSRSIHPLPYKSNNLNNHKLFTPTTDTPGMKRGYY